MNSFKTGVPFSSCHVYISSVLALLSFHCWSLESKTSWLAESQNKNDNTGSLQTSDKTAIVLTGTKVFLDPPADTPQAKAASRLDHRFKDCLSVLLGTQWCNFWLSEDDGEGEGEDGEGEEEKEMITHQIGEGVWYNPAHVQSVW